MKPRIKVLTLGVDDLERSLRFYREGLGLETEGIIGTEFVHGSVVFFDLEGGLKLALYPRKSARLDASTRAAQRNRTVNRPQCGLQGSSRRSDEASESGVVPPSSSRRRTLSGVATVDTFKTPMGISGRSCGILNG